MRSYRTILCVSVLLIALLGSSCKETVGPTVTDSDLFIGGGFVRLSADPTKPAGTFDWGGIILNRSKVEITAGLTLELKNVDDVIFHTSQEQLVVVSARNNVTFEIEENGTQVPLPVFSSIKDWNMKIRVVAFK